jgi:drug efflux transport system permease protein
MNRSRLLAMARKETLHLRRDPRSLLLAFLLPVALIIFFGYAITMDIEHIPLAVLDQCRTEASRSLIQSFPSSRYFDIVARPDDPAEVDALLVSARVKAVLVIGPDFARDLGSARPAPVQLLLDGTDANTATIAQNYAQAIVSRWSAGARGGATVLPAEAESRIWYNETLESRNTVVPGLVAVIMSIIAALLTAPTIAREWERGTMEQLAATPVGRLEVVVGKLLPYVAIGLFDVGLAVAAGIGLFHVPFRGSLGLLFVFTLVFLVGTLAFGMFISATVKGQVLSTQVAIQTTYLPAMLLSGFIFSIPTMPWVLRTLTHVIPSRYYVTVTKGIFLKGVGADVLWIEAAALVIFALASMGLAVRAFRKELE